MISEELAYIAGFLDGDGCIMLQLVPRRGYLLGYQIRASVVFYQKQVNRAFLEWLKVKLEDGYIRDRNDGMSEYTIVGVESVTKILSQLKPYIVLKQPQVELALAVLSRMPVSGRDMTAPLLAELAVEVDKFSELNYSKKRVNRSEKVINFLISMNRFDPVETDS